MFSEIVSSTLTLELGYLSPVLKKEIFSWQLGIQSGVLGLK